MNFIFYIIITFFLIILQTIVFQYSSWFDYSFDLQLVNILYLSLMFSHYSVIPVILLIGCAMDSLSGGPFFYYMFSYFWIWVIVQGMKRFVFSKSIWFLLMISLVSVLIEHIFLILSVFSMQGKMFFTGLNFGQMTGQIVSGVIIIPVALWTMNLVFQNYIYLSRRMIKHLRRI